MAAGFPSWGRLVLRLERTIGVPVESAVHSGSYFDLVAELNRTKAKLMDTVEGISKRAWHLANLFAGTDIRRMRQQLAGVERRPDPALEGARGAARGATMKAPVLLVPGGHATFGTGRSALEHTLPRLSQWIALRSNA